MNDVELVLTFKCDWDCDYCLVDTHAQPDMEYEEVLHRANAIEPNSEVTFSGGEPGLLPKRRLLQLIKILKDKGCVLDILTNGLFIKKHIDLIDNFEEVLYHCVEYLGNDIQFPNLDQDKVTYILVVTDENFIDGSILNMISRYPHIKFLLLPDVRKCNKVNLNAFMKFMELHSGKIHPRTMEDFIVDIGRSGHEVIKQWQYTQKKKK